MMTAKEYRDNVQWNWVMQQHYPGYQRFLKLFNEEERKSYKMKLPAGSLAVNSYNDENFDFPHDVDPDGHYEKFVLSVLQQHFPIYNLKHRRTWWLHYPKFEHSFVGVHRHEGERVLTSVLFLESNLTENNMNEPGTLFAITQENDRTNELHEFLPVPGQCVIMDGMVYHGTYPTQFDRKVLVVDYDYEIIEDD